MHEEVPTNPLAFLEWTNDVIQHKKTGPKDLLKFCFWTFCLKKHLDQPWLTWQNISTISRRNTKSFTLLILAIFVTLSSLRLATEVSLEMTMNIHEQIHNPKVYTANSKGIHW